MKLRNLYDKQYNLDKLVEDRLQVIDPTFKVFGLDNLEKKVLAFKVELAELSNEVAFFKYWKHNHVMNRVRVLDEWADCLHFLLSVGLTHHYDSQIESISSQVKPALDLDIVQHLVVGLMELRMTDFVEYRQALCMLITMGNSLGFTEDELLDAYETKNKVNVQRQLGGY